MAFDGQWELQASKQIYDFCASTMRLVVRHDEAQESPPADCAPTPAAGQTFLFDVNEANKTVTLTPLSEGTAEVPAKTRRFLITSRSDNNITLRRIPEKDDDSMEEEILVLVPVGYPGPMPSMDDSGCAQDGDDSDSGVDMGMDLCVVGKKITR